MISFAETMGAALRKAHLLGKDPVIITVNVGDVMWAGTDNDVSTLVENND